MRTYDAMFIFPESLDDTGVEKAVETVRSEISRCGGGVSDVKQLGKHNFARRLKKAASGRYVRFSFDMPPEKLAGFKSRLALNESVFRAQILSKKAGGAGDVAVTPAEPETKNGGEIDG